MKKVIVMLLALLMILTAVACTTEPGKTPGGATGDHGGPNAGSDDLGADTTENTYLNHDLPEGLNFNDQTIVIHTRGDYNSVDEIFVEDTSNQVFEAIYKRNLAVEELLKVRIEPYKSAGWDSYYTVANAQLRATISSGDAAYDIVSGWQPCIPELATEGLFTNLLSDTYVDAEKPWWSQSLVKDLTIADQLNFVTGDISTFTMLGSMRIFVCNSQLAEEHQIPNLYEVVRNGDWTIDYVTELTKNLYVDTGNSVVDEADIYGIQIGCANDVDGFLASARISMSERDADGIPYVVMPVEKMTSLVEKLHAMMYKNPGAFVTGADAADVAFRMMQENRLLMAAFPMDTLRVAFNDLQSDFMVLPYPKLDEAQTEYGTRIQDALQIWGIPTDITGARLDAASATLEAMACESYNSVTSVYFDTALKGRYTRDEESKEMMDLIKKSVYISFEMIYNSYIGNPCYVLRNLMSTESSDFASWWGKRNELIPEEFNKVIDMIIDNSYTE